MKPALLGLLLSFTACICCTALELWGPALLFAFFTGVFGRQV